MTDLWYFEIGDGQVYGPFPLATLQAWAASGDLMPTHRVRHADSSEWTIAAYVAGLEMTNQAPPAADTADDSAGDPSLVSQSLVALGRVWGKNRRRDLDESDETESSSPSPGRGSEKTGTGAKQTAVEFCDELLELGYKRGASDIHVDPEERILLVQLRVDGVLEPLRKLPKSAHSSVIGRFKVLAGMDIAEHRSPQDGRFRYQVGPKDVMVDIRAAVLPTTHGERITLRLMAVETEQLTINRLGLSHFSLEAFTAALATPQGLVLITGPTGSGKSTTLYAALRHRLAHHPGRIITVEDPVEFDIVGVAQVEVDTADRVQFNTVLRNILRSDPDVIMIGEIRDFESADLAIKAALTGHLVLSSLHTNTAAGAVTRLVDMGVEPYLLAATVRLCVAQRLVRKLCDYCRTARNLTEAEAAALGRPDAKGSTVYEPGGCAKCDGRGFRGRIGLFETIAVDDSLARRIASGADERELERHQKKRNLSLLVDDAADKLLAGKSSFREVMAASSVTPIESSD